MAHPRSPPIESTHVQVEMMEPVGSMFSEEHDSTVWFFRVMAVKTSNPDIATRVAYSGCQMNGEINDLGAAADWYVVTHARDDIEKLHLAGKRCLVVMDTATFPRIAAYIDSRDQATMRKNRLISDFDIQVIQRWQTYDMAVEIPMVVVNANTTFTGLKLVPFSLTRSPGGTNTHI